MVFHLVLQSFYSSLFFSCYCFCFLNKRHNQLFYIVSNRVDTNMNRASVFSMKTSYRFVIAKLLCTNVSGTESIVFLYVPLSILHLYIVFIYTFLLCPKLLSLSGFNELLLYSYEYEFVVHYELECIVFR